MATFSISVKNFDQWRTHTRAFLQHGIQPSDIHWSSPNQGAFDFAEDFSLDNVELKHPKIEISKKFVNIAKDVACHSRKDRWALLYRVAWRILFENKALLAISIDDDVAALAAMQKSLARDRHKMKAFVRFRRVNDDRAPSDAVDEANEAFIAWFEPQHHILASTAPFFVKRFANMKWTIITPEACAHWDKTSLHVEEAEFQAPALEDELEELWLEYYKNIFNPARLKLKAMQAEMPKKYWINLPEAPLIHQLQREANGKVREMMENTATSTPTKAMRSRAVQEVQTTLQNRRKKDNKSSD